MICIVFNSVTQKSIEGHWVSIDCLPHHHFSRYNRLNSLGATCAGMTNFAIFFDFLHNNYRYPIATMQDGHKSYIPAENFSLASDYTGITFNITSPDTVP